MNVTLNGNEMTTKESAHIYLKRILQLPDYYGHNLDALWDLLSTINKPLTITLCNSDQLLDHLGEYGHVMIEVFKSAAIESEQIVFELK